jgi:hypothetical protein
MTLITGKSNDAIYSTNHKFRMMFMDILSVVAIELKGSYLACSQVCPLAIEDQIVLFNLPCDLAGLAEYMGSESASSDIRRN